nr:reverse transcriptase domain-containing protein [Tanacetum cinerariifolium]
AIISDRGTHFCNDKFAKVISKYGVTHRLSTAYHPQTGGQVEVSNQGLKRILERMVRENRASWYKKLDDALWAFRTAYKTPIGCTPYKLVYGKSCHLPIELEHKAYWALKHVNFDLKTGGDHRKLQLNELNELRDQAYENSLIYKEKTKKIHDSMIKNHIFNVGDRVLLFNSRLTIFSGKLKTRWSGPFTITKVFPYGTVELSQLNGSNFKVNGHRVKRYFGGDVPQLVVSNLQTSPWTNECGDRVKRMSDLDTMSLDDLYNHLMVYKAEVQKKSEPNTQNMAFISSTIHSRGNDEVNTTSVYTASSNVPTASVNVATANINQINEDDMEEMDIKWNMALLSMGADKFWKKTGKKISIQGSDVAGFDKSKVECFNCHKMGHFARECRASRNQDRGRRDTYRQGSKAEQQAPKALMAIDGVGWDWIYMANEEEDHAYNTPCFRVIDIVNKFAMYLLYFTRLL